MGLAADVAEAIKNGRGPVAGGMGNSLYEKVKENMKNAEFIGSLMHLNQIFEGPGKYARGLIGTVIPTAVANIAKTTDRTVRSSQTILHVAAPRVQ